VRFHSGDTVMWRGLAEDLRAARVDTCLLPINGRDWLREEAGLVGNLTVRESADLAAACGAEVRIPVHFDGVVGNTGSPGGAGRLRLERLSAAVGPAARPRGRPPAPAAAVAARRHHSASAPSSRRQSGLRHRWPTFAARSTSAASMSIPSPGPVSAGT
jgi:hypothetical protein